ncbi:MAG: phosphoenolpyruvate carboxykinase (ATP), partial [Candidatus Omnitrophica bacterium]|nr:phosphoenolpyruvate carboxykinase (ATP) [Candidatus Omnitrophota bacterium]
KNIIFLTCDAFGVLPPVAKLTKEQAMYHYLSGYTAKVAGTELGVNEPQATFSACFGKAFLTLHPVKYAEILARKMEEHHSDAYLINTGWVGGSYGQGFRISIKDNRSIIDAIIDGTLADMKWQTLSDLNLAVPVDFQGLETPVNPREAWADKEKYDQAAHKLAEMFVKNFEQFTDCKLGQGLVSAGPRSMNCQGC